MSSVLVVSHYFRVSEMDCHDGTPYPVAYYDRLNRLFSQLDIVRGLYGGPLQVVSGYRTLEYNRRIGGALASQHMEGTAADIRPITDPALLGPAVELLNTLIKSNLARLPLLGGIGHYPGRWMHLDVRTKNAGHIATWEGAGIGSERNA
jgi:uncharacterized protein YcbK (DUF882 family)